MTENRMYSQRTKNIPVFRGCDFGCVYCSFKRLIQMNRKCTDCAEFKPHSHMEVLQRNPPRTKEGEFLTIGLSGDISFMLLCDFWQVIEYCHKWKDRTFLIQSKNPAYFLRFNAFKIPVPDNVILGTTIETNRYWPMTSFQTGEPIYNKGIAYSEISKAPRPFLRYEAMLKLNCRKAVTIEPILDFDLDVLAKWIQDISPEFVYIGYANDRYEGKKLKLPEPPLAKTQELIARLRESGIEVRCKSLRKAWWE